MEKGMTLRDLSVKSHTSLGYLSEVERGSKEVSSTVLDSIAQGLEVPLSKIVEDASQYLREDEVFVEIAKSVYTEKELTW
jgi:transcriptional regulator with XRE-family HTH domain